MPKTHITEGSLKQLYNECAESTKNFTEITPDNLVENPKRLLIYRLMLNMSQPKFGRLLNIDDGNIPKYELGRIRKMQYKTAERFINQITKRLQVITYDKLLVNFNRFEQESMGWFKVHNESSKLLRARREAAAKTLEKRPTSQETEISETFDKKGINYKRNYYFDKNRGIIVDFLIHFKSKPIIIECKYINSKYSREVTGQIRRLAYQGYKIKYYHNVYFIGFIESQYKLRERDYQELKGPCDWVFTNKEKLCFFLMDFISH